MRGPAEAPVTLVEYGDFECLDTARVAPVLRELLRRHAGRVRVVYRHYPIRHKHPLAQWAAEAAEAAGAQDCFWEMHDTLFVHQQLLGDEHLDLYLRQLRLDADRLRHDLATHIHAPRVQADYDGGQRSGVTGTPALFINDTLHDGYLDTASLDAAITAALDQR